MTKKQRRASPEFEAAVQQLYRMGLVEAVGCRDGLPLWRAVPPERLNDAQKAYRDALAGGDVDRVELARQMLGS
jgi:hypothetical protein